jgi:site-specific DNA-methyltransferase (cytosine-N4-specific)
LKARFTIPSSARRNFHRQAITTDGNGPTIPIWECGPYDLRDRPKELHNRLAKHILLNLYGTTLVQTIQDMQAAGEDVNLKSLRAWLEDRGVHFPRGGKHASMMKLWLEKAGVFSSSGWRINEARLQEVRGVGTEELEALAKLNPGQRFFLRTLLNLSATGATPASEVEKLATATYGFKYNEKGLAKDILYPARKSRIHRCRKDHPGQIAEHPADREASERGS